MQHIHKTKISIRKYSWGGQEFHLAKRHKPLHCWLSLETGSAKHTVTVGSLWG